MSNILISETIDSFFKSLSTNFASDLTSRWSIDMECQIMVDPTQGTPVYDGDKLIRNTWQVCSDENGTYNYHHLRIPKNSMSDPFFNDRPLGFPLQRHIECIGMTGWNWQKKQSLWVAFDFDAITGHAQGVGVSNDALEKVREFASDIPWVQVRKSTSGSGLHLYVYFDPEDAPQTENHNVHAALARSVLGLMEKETGFDFRGNMDVLGGNMWVWHKKVSNSNRGLAVLKDYDIFCPNLPDNWKDNIDVVTGKSGKVRFNGINKEDYESFEAQTASRNKTKVDETHKLVEERIHNLGYTIIWVPDHHCWQTHTRAFAELMEEYPEDYRGIYETLSEGTDKGGQNCFAFPVSNGGFRITRFGKGAREHKTWYQDGTDWTWTYFNRSPSLMEAATFFGGVEDPDGKGWVVNDVDDVIRICQSLGDEFHVPDHWADENGMKGRKFLLRGNKSNQLVIEMQRKRDEQVPSGWIEKNKSKFVTLLKTAKTESVTEDDEINYDDRVRALVDTNNEFYQWVILNENSEWIVQNKDNTRSALKIWAADKTEDVLGKLIISNWKIVNVPFQPEYLGQRMWNRNAPQFSVQPDNPGKPHPHWDMILDHCGQDLDESVQDNKWCREAGINTGADYLAYWIACLLRDPYCKLPYLFFYGPQNSGKSIFHEAISTLISRGIVYADEALQSKSNFNGEIADAVLCVVEETNLGSHNSSAYDRMKAWVTGEEILIHAKYQQPHQVKNTTHWCQMANDKAFCPIAVGDTRVVMIHVPMLETVEIPKSTLLQHLKEQAPAFLRMLLDLRLPTPPGRTRLPVLETDSKTMAQEDNKTIVDKFLETQCYPVDGALVRFREFYEALSEWMQEEERGLWTYNRVVDEFRNREMLPMGKQLNNVLCIGNISLNKPEPDTDYGKPWVRQRQKLIQA